MNCMQEAYMFGLQKKNESKTEAVVTDRPAQTYVPAVDIAETDTGYTIYADVPGATKDSVDVTFENGVVALKAQAASASETREGHALYREFSRASYERSFRVGDDVDAENIGAEITQGVLKVTLPKKVSAKKTISIK